MGDRRFDRDEPHRPEPHEREISLTELVDGVVRKVVTAIVLAGGLVALGAWAGGSGDVEAPRYQITAADGRVYRVNTESGSIVACAGNQCAVIQRGNRDLGDGPAPTVKVEIGTDRPPALPPPDNAAAPAPAPAPAPAQR